MGKIAANNVHIGVGIAGCVVGIGLIIAAIASGGAFLWWPRGFMLLGGVIFTGIGVVFLSTID